MFFARKSVRLHNFALVVRALAVACTLHCAHDEACVLRVCIVAEHASELNAMSTLWIDRGGVTRCDRIGRVRWGWWVGWVAGPCLSGESWVAKPE